MRNVLYALFIVLSIIGAGFASGEEIRIFFGEFSLFSVFKIILFAVLSFFVLKFFLSVKNDVKNTKAGKLYSLLSLICYICVSGSMISALGTISGKVCGIMLAGICAVIAYFGFKYISKIFDYLSVILILGFILGIIILFINKYTVNNNYTIYATDTNYIFVWFNILMYVLCNVFLSSELIFSISGKTTKKDINKIAGISTGVLTVLLILISVLIKGVNSTMPLLTIAKTVSSLFHIFYLILLCVAIISTLLTVLYGIKQSSKKLKVNYFFIIPVVFILGMFNFSFLVQYLTIIEGCLGLGYIIASHKPLNKISA